MGAPNQLSFLPEDYLQLKAQRRTNVICAVLFVAVIGGIMSVFYASDKQDKAINDHHSQVSREVMEKAKRIDQVKQMQDKQRQMAHQAELTSSLLEKVPRSYLLAEITNAMPTGVSLVDFTMESKRRSVPTGPVARTEFERKKMEMEAQARGGGIAVPQSVDAPQYDVTMKMSGIARTDVLVAQFISKLSLSKLMKEVNLVQSEEHKQADEKVRMFQIEMTLDPRAEVQPNKPDAKTASAGGAVEAK